MSFSFAGSNTKLSSIRCHKTKTLLYDEVENVLSRLYQNCMRRYLYEEINDSIYKAKEKLCRAKHPFDNDLKI